MERIECAAIRNEGVIYFLPRPNRHWKILHTLWGNRVETVDGPDEQGFLTNKGRYVNRKQGMSIAVRAGQVERSNRKYLHTEDLW